MSVARALHREGPVRAPEMMAAMMVGVPMGVLGLAGLAKVWDLDQFHASLASWTLLPAWGRGPIAILVPLVEILVAGLWFARIAPRRAEWAAIGLLLGFAGTFAAHLALGIRPRCNCLGALLQAEATRGSAHWLLWRDGALVALLGGGIIVRRGTFSRRSKPGKET